MGMKIPNNSLDPSPASKETSFRPTFGYIPVRILLSVAQDINKSSL